MFSLAHLSGVPASPADDFTLVASKLRERFRMHATSKLAPVALTAVALAEGKEASTLGFVSGAEINGIRVECKTSLRLAPDGTSHIFGFSPNQIHNPEAGYFLLAALGAEVTRTRVEPCGHFMVMTHAEVLEVYRNRRAARVDTFAINAKSLSSRLSVRQNAAQRLVTHALERVKREGLTGSFS